LNGLFEPLALTYLYLIYFKISILLGGNIMAIEARIEGNKLIITCDLETPTPSASGKTLVVASTRGNMKTDLTVNGKPLTIGLNAYTSK